MNDSILKCAICNCKTTDSTSYGRYIFNVCSKCYNKLSRAVNDKYIALDLILEIGAIKEDVEKDYNKGL